MKYLLWILFLFGSGVLRAQENSSFKYAELAATYTRVYDSVQASEAFLKINPYYLLYLRVTPATLDTFYRGWALTTAAKEQYREIFRKAWLAPKTEMYMAMEDAHVEYNKLKQAHLDAAANMESVALAKMDKLDSINAAGLYEYVTMKGWPSIENGGLYAGQIVMRDYWHYPYYDTSGIIKKAVDKGILGGHVERYLEENKGNLGMRKQIQRLLAHGYLSFDVTDFLYNPRPEVMNRIVQTIKDSCPVKAILMVYEVKTKADHQRVVAALKTLERTTWMDNSENLHGQAAKACPEFFNSERYDPFELGHMGTTIIYNGRRNEKIVLYVVPGRRR